MNLSVVLKQTKETKGTFRFDSDDPDAVISNLYIRKSAFDGPAPKEITLTVS